MATVYYGVNLGQHTQDVVVATSTNSTDVELAINTANVKTREQADELVRYITGAVKQQVFPYA